MSDVGWRCGWCGAPGTHHLTHVCAGCTCHFTEVTIPGEPQLGSYLEGEQNPDCPIHGRPDPDAEVIEALLAAGLTDDANLIESDTARIARRYLANLRERGWDVVRRAES